MTNADVIRSMSDEELARFLEEWEFDGYKIDYSITFCDLCEEHGNDLNYNCSDCRLHWLKKDCEDVFGLKY